MVRTPTVKTCFALLAALVAISQSQTSWSSAQTPPKNDEQERQLRLRADLVQVRAVVTDKRGQTVRGLKKEDFEILEENRPQEISFFSVEDVDQSVKFTNARHHEIAAQPAKDVARTIVLFVDTVHTSFANVEQHQACTEAIRRRTDD